MDLMEDDGTHKQPKMGFKFNNRINEQTELKIRGIDYISMPVGTDSALRNN
jgi:hypothetical protein